MSDGHNKPTRRSRGPIGRVSAFTLVELLVVVAIIALLIALLLPSLRVARVQARVVMTHSDLRQIRLALDCYQNDWAERLPPVRTGCSLRAAYELPPELALREYLPADDEEGIIRVALSDPFTQTYYRYRAVGAVLMNDVTLLEPPAGAKLYIPDEFPSRLTEPGRYIRYPDESPLAYGIWSMGPEPEASKLSNNPGRAPVLQRFWMTGPNDVGIITHLISKTGDDIFSP